MLDSGRSEGFSTFSVRADLPAVPAVPKPQVYFNALVLMLSFLEFIAYVFNLL